MYKRKLVFAAACITMLIFGIALTSLGSILPDISKAYNLNDLQRAGLVAFLPIGIILGSILFGPLVDRYGYKGLLIISVGITLVGFEMLAYSSDFNLLRFAIFLIGTGGGIINGGSNTLASDITTGQKGASISLVGVFYGIGALGLPLVYGLLSKSYSYRVIISDIGILLVLILVYLVIIKFPEAKQSQGFPVKSAVKLFRNPLILVLGFILFFESGLEGLMLNWTPTFMERINISKEEALFALSVHTIGLTVGRLVLGFLLEKLAEKKVMYFSYSLVMFACLVLINAKSYTASMIALVLMGFGFAAIFPVILGFVGSKFKEISGTAFSLVLVIALIGNTLINYFMGVISNSFGINVLPIYAAICVIMMTLLATIYFIRFNNN